MLKGSICMLKVYNKNALTRHERFQNAIVVGALTAIGCLVLSYVLINVYHVYFSIIFIAIGYVIGYMIQKYGKGVQPKFSLLAGGLTLAVCLIIEFMMYGSLQGIISNLTADVYSLLELIYIGAGCYLAYTNARIV